MTAVPAVIGPLALAGGIMVFRFSSMARATMALLTSFLATGGLLIWLGLAYLGTMVILMMVMEMVIMAVFMIAYMMNPAGLMPMSMLHNRRASAGISVAVFGLLAAAIFLTSWPAKPVTPPRDPTFRLGEELMGPQMLTMITLGVTLLATMVSAVVLSAQRGRYDRFGDDLKRRPPSDPAGGGLSR